MQEWRVLDPDPRSVLPDTRRQPRSRGQAAPALRRERFVLDLHPPGDDQELEPARVLNVDGGAGLPGFEPTGPRACRPGRRGTTEGVTC